VKTEMRINPKQFDHLQLDFEPQLNDGILWCAFKILDPQNNLNFTSISDFSSFVDNCLNDGVGTFQEDLPLQVKGIQMD
jgi:hypothetical protein